MYLAGSAVSNTGTWMQRVAQDWLVLQLPGTSGTELGITTGLQFLPVLLLSPYAGVIADRFPKRRLLQVTQATMAAASLVLGLIAVLGVAQTWHVYLIAFLFGIGAAFDAPARQSFVSEMVGHDELTNAVGLNSASFNAARILGPALAGLIKFRDSAPFVQLYFDTALGASIGGAMNDEIALLFAGEASPQDVVDATQTAVDQES